MANYVIERQTPTVYADKAGRAIQGFVVTGTFPEFDEVFEVRVPSLDGKTVIPVIEQLLEQRRKLAEFGG